VRWRACQHARVTEISERGVDHATAVPASVWVFAWSCVAVQVLELARRGAQPPDDWPLSMLLGVALVTFFSHGVLRARWVRFWLVVVLVAVALVAFVDRSGRRPRTRLMHVLPMNR
jgi:CHASE2 domain-containing sensor protein